MGVAMSSVRELNRMLERVDRRLGMHDDKEDIGPLGLGKKGRPFPRDRPEASQAPYRDVNAELYELYAKVESSPNVKRNWHVDQGAGFYRFHECLGRYRSGDTFSFRIYYDNEFGDGEHHEPEYGVTIPFADALKSWRGGRMVPIRYTSSFKTAEAVVEFLDSVFYKE